MDADRFDRLARSLGTTSRRGALRLLAGGALGSFLGLLGRGEAGAAHGEGCKRVTRRCAKDGDCCSGRCRRGRCRTTTNPDPACAGGDGCSGGVAIWCGPGGSMDCWCATTVEGGGICNWDNGCGAECATSADCGPNAVCVDAPCCETATDKVCVPFALRCKFFHL